MTTDWQENTGVVPDGVDDNTVVEVHYKDAAVTPPAQPGWNDPDLWIIMGDGMDIARYRIVE